MITVFGCPVNSDYLEMLLKSAGYDPADESGVVKIVATDDGKITAHWPDGTTSELVGATAGGTAGVTDFISLTDTPSAYSGSETYYLVVNSAGDSVVFEDRPNYLNGFDLYNDDTLPEVSFDGTTSRTITVSPKTASGTFVFWSDNKKFTKTASETVTIPDTTGGYYIYYDDSGTLQYATDPPSSDLLTKYALVAHVYWNADYPSEYIWNDNELHGIDMRGAEHLYAHYAFGARWKSGLDINGLTVGSTDYTGSDSGYIYDEDIEHSFSANTAGHPWLYRWGSDGAWRKSAADLKVAYKESGDTYYSYNWYNTASGTWEWKEGTSSTDYWITFFAAVPGVGIVKVPGQAAYSNRANARDAIPTELSRLETEGLPNPEICWLGAVIVKRDGKLQSLADGTVFYDLRMGRGGGTTSKAASAFIDLTDTPSSYSGEAGKAPLVKSTEDGLEFVDVATAGHTHSWSDVSKSGSMLSDIGDVPAYQADKVLGVDSSGTALQWVTNSGGGGTAGATTYLELDDTPSSYSGHAGEVPVVKSDESGLDWFEAASAGHTHTASEITDFDDEVSNNTDVAANTSARHSHSNKTLLDSLINSGSGTEFLADDGSYKAVSTVDEKVKADSGDSSAGYLSDKVDGTTIEVNTSSHTIQVVDGIYASVGHTHDDRYYTESETDNLLDAKADKVSGATSGNFAGLDSNGNLTDSGKNASDFAAASHTHTASDISDFDTEVSNNTDVAANTSARHSHSNKSLLDSLISSGSGTNFLADDGTYKAGTSGSDEKVKADSGDTTAGYLSDKVDDDTIKVNTASHTMYIPDTKYVPKEEGAVMLWDVAAEYLTGTGYLQIKTPFPCTSNSTLLNITVNYFSYQQTTASQRLHGYAYYGTPAWVNISNFAITGSPHKARFGYVDGKWTIWLGESDTAWNYSVISIPRVIFKQLAGAITDTTSWDLSIVTALGTVTSSADPYYGPNDKQVSVSSSTTAGYLYEVISGSLTIDTATETLQLDGDESSPGAWKVYGTNGSGTRGWYDMETPKYTKLIAYNSSGRPEYVGEANPGTATSASSWRIKKLTYDTDGNITAVKWADGNSNFDNVWDNRTSYSYS